MDWYLKVLKNYFGFSGRARRKEYWMFTLVHALISITLAIVDAVISSGESDIGVLGLLYTFAVLIPSLGVSVRRLHDTNRSGWWLLIALVPLIGALVLLVFVLTEGNHGNNTYGEDPKTHVGGVTVLA